MPAVGSARPEALWTWSPKVSALITEAALCTDCLADKTGLAVPRIDELLIQIRGNLVVASGVACCDACLKQTVVHRIA
jgi:hypothetical protein